MKKEAVENNTQFLLQLLLIVTFQEGVNLCFLCSPWQSIHWL